MIIYGWVSSSDHRLRLASFHNVQPDVSVLGLHPGRGVQPKFRGASWLPLLSSTCGEGVQLVFPNLSKGQKIIGRKALGWFLYISLCAVCPNSWSLLVWIICDIAIAHPRPKERALFKKLVTVIQLPPYLSDIRHAA